MFFIFEFNCKFQQPERWLNMKPQDVFRTLWTSKMKLSAKIVHSSITFFARSSIVDIWSGLQMVPNLVKCNIKYSIMMSVPKSAQLAFFIINKETWQNSCETVVTRLKVSLWKINVNAFLVSKITETRLRVGIAI